MSLTLKQQPAYLSQRIHQKVYPVYYTVQSNQYSLSDFSYKFTLNDQNGIVQTTLNPPYIKGGLGVFAPDAIKNKLEFNFNPDIVNQITECKNSMINYRVDIEEHSDSLTSPASSSFSKCYVLNATKEGFDYSDYINNDDDKKTLTDWVSTRKVTINDRGTMRAIGGKIRTNISYVYQLYLIKTDTSGNQYFYHSQFVNPYYGNTTVNGTSNYNTTLESMDEYIIEFPLLPYNINNSMWVYVGYTPYGGSFSAVTPSVVTTNILSNNDKYSIQTYAWPQGNGGITSKKYNFEITNPCDKDVEYVVQFGWLNQVGGVDYYTAYYNRTETNKITKKLYQQIRDKQGHNQTYYNNDYYIGHSDYDRGSTVINSEYESEWSVYTDYLSKQEIEDLSSLFYSPEVYARIQGVWYPIIITNEKYLKTIDKRGLKNIEIKFIISNKKYF